MLQSLVSIHAHGKIKASKRCFCGICDSHRADLTCCSLKEDGHWHWLFISRGTSTPCTLIVATALMAEMTLERGVCPACTLLVSNSVHISCLILRSLIDFLTLSVLSVPLALCLNKPPLNSPMFVGEIEKHWQLFGQTYQFVSVEWLFLYL